MAPALGDFRLAREVRLPPTPGAGTVDGTNLVPENQYRHPLRIEPLAGPVLRPGALQDANPGAPEQPAKYRPVSPAASRRDAPLLAPVQPRAQPRGARPTGRVDCTSASTPANVPANAEIRTRIRLPCAGSATTSIASDASDPATPPVNAPQRAGWHAGAGRFEDLAHRRERNGVDEDQVYRHRRAFRRALANEVDQASAATVAPALSCTNARGNSPA